MDQILVVFATEQFVGSFQIRGRLTLIVNDFKFHYTPAFTAGRTMMLLLMQPGTAPLTSSN